MALSTPDALVGRDVKTVTVPRVSALPLAVAAASAGLAGLAWGAPLVARMVTDGDFPFHIASAEQFAATGRITVPHFLLQVVLGTIVAAQIFDSALDAGAAFFSLLYVTAAAATCWYIARGAERSGSLIASVVLATAVLMVAPIFPRAESGLYLIGYFPPNVYHNPTMLLAKPLLVWTLVSAVAACTRSGPAGVRELILLAVPVVLLGVAKPNYLGCLIPVLVLLPIWNRLDGMPVSVSRLSAICGAAIGTLVASWALYQSDQLGFEAGVVIAPLQVIALYAPVDGFTIARSLVASLAFPLVVLALWPRDTWRDAAMRIAWAATAVGLVISYVLAESGPRFSDGNFLWTGQMAVFVLFVAAARFARTRLTLRGASSATFARLLAVGVALAFHVEAGIRHAAMKLETSKWLAFWM